jgi:hypothetical protein
MNKIAIVGHPASGYREVLALLQESGMTAARPSRRDRLLPQDINATLMAAHKAAPLSSVLDEEGFTPIETGPVWHGMALDLMLGNLDEPLWGWADPQAIYALDYWKQLDPQLTFVLVYDEPHRVLMDHACTERAPPSSEDLDRLLDNWTAYNSALLRFYLRHSARSVLVHAQQARRAASTYLQQLQHLLDTPLSLRDLHAESDTDATDLPALGAPLLPAALGQAVAAAGAELQQAAALLGAGAAERYLVDGVLAHHRRALQLHDELQSAASLPLDRKRVAAGSPAVAWETLVTQRNFVTNLLTQIHAKYQDASEELSRACTRLDDACATQARENERLLGQLRQLQEALNAEKTKAAEQRKERQESSVEYDKKLGALGAENQRLSGQLQQLQRALAAEKAKAADQRKDREKASVEYEKKLHELRAENELQLTQLHRVQEELEQVFLRKQALEQREVKNAARNKAAAERAKRRIKGLIFRLKQARQRIKSEGAYEAERVRQQISYRLGQVVLRHGRTPWGWLMLPYALIREAREYGKQEQEVSG